MCFCVIASFGDKGTADLYHGIASRPARQFPPEVARTAVRKLDLINAAAALQDLRAPPGNRLEALRGDLKGYYSIRVNQQWRLTFRWAGFDAEDVRLVDYH